MVSVIVPIYNASGYLRKCVGSILNQTYEDIEVILVNDGSTDDSLTIAREFAIKDSRIIVIDQQNTGVSGARNHGLNMSKGDYVLFVDSDDWLENNMIERMITLVIDGDIVFCGHDNAISYKDVSIVKSIQIEIWDQKKQQLEFMKHKKMTGMLWNKLFRRSLTDDISFDETIDYGEDADFLWKVLKKSKRMVVTNEVLYHHVLEETSISHCSFSSKKYSAIPMWETIVSEVETNYPDLLNLAKERLMCAAVFSKYEAKKCGYKNKEQLSHIRKIIRENFSIFITSCNVSKKFKLYALAVLMGY